MSRTERQQKIDRYAEGFAVLQHAFSEAPETSLRWKPSATDWSIHEVIIHCADAELQGSIRFRLLAAGPTPVILDWDQEHWARALNYHDQPLEPALALVGAIRSSTTALIATFDDAVWSAVGTHTVAGPYSADNVLDTYHDHLHVHAAQIRGNIESWRETTSA